MMIVPAGVKVHLALGYTDMRKGMDGLAMLVQGTLKKDPFSGHLLAFVGKKAHLRTLMWINSCGSTRNATAARRHVRRPRPGQGDHSRQGRGQPTRLVYSQRGARRRRRR